MQLTGFQSRALALVGAALAIGGCTVGQVVDASFNPFPVGGERLIFEAVDSNNQSTGKSYDYHFTTGDTSVNASYVSFDPYAPAGLDANSGITNVKQAIPGGSYFISLVPDNLSSGWSAVSPIFQHSYPDTCNDFLTGSGGEPCAKYYFQIHFGGCGDPLWGGCCTGLNNCAVSSLPTHNGVPVIPLYVTTGG